MAQALKLQPPCSVAHTLHCFAERLQTPLSKSTANATNAKHMTRYCFKSHPNGCMTLEESCLENKFVEKMNFTDKYYAS